MTCSLLSLQRRVRQETAEELDALRHRWAGPLFGVVLWQHAALCLWFCSSVERLRAERGALRCAEAELRRRLEAAREVGGHSGALLLSRACDLLCVMCMQDAACKGRMVVDLETQLACLERKMADEWEVWRRAELNSEREREALQQALSESQSQQQLQVELEGEAVTKRLSTVSLDLDLTREIDHLNKVGSSVPIAFRGRGIVLTSFSQPLPGAGPHEGRECSTHRQPAAAGKGIGFAASCEPAHAHLVVLHSTLCCLSLQNSSLASELEHVSHEKVR